MGRLADGIDSELSRGLELRERGAKDERTYRVHRKLAEPCHVCGTPIAQVDFEEHTIYYCPGCQTGGRILRYSAGCRGCCASLVPPCGKRTRRASHRRARPTAPTGLEHPGSDGGREIT